MNPFQGFNNQQLQDLGFSTEDMNIVRAMQQGLSRPSNNSVKRGPEVFQGSPTRKIRNIMDDVDQDRPITIDDPTSYRFYKKAEDGQEYDVSLNEYSGSHKKAIASTCVKSVRYDPKSGKCWLKFVGGEKEYLFLVPKDQFADFLEATSKGRHTNYVLKKYCRAPESMWS